MVKIRRFISILFMSYFFTSFTFSQENVFDWSILPLNLGVGYNKFSNVSNLNQESNFVVNSFKKNSINLNILENQFYYKKIGLIIGFDYHSINLNQNIITSDFKNNFDNHTVYFPQTDYENGVVPIVGKYGQFFFKSGLGFQIINRNIKILPSISFLIPVNQSHYSLTANLIDNITTDTSEFTYSYQEKSKLSIKTGIELRYKIKKNERLIFGLKLEYGIINGSGESYYKEVKSDGTIFNSPRSLYSRNSHNFSILWNIGFRIK